jgi:hypothetical protein
VRSDAPIICLAPSTARSSPSTRRFAPSGRCLAPSAPCFSRSTSCFRTSSPRLCRVPPRFRSPPPRWGGASEAPGRRRKARGRAHEPRGDAPDAAQARLLACLRALAVPPNRVRGPGYPPWAPGRALDAYRRKHEPPRARMVPCRPRSNGQRRARHAPVHPRGPSQVRQGGPRPTLESGASRHDAAMASRSWEPQGSPWLTASAGPPCACPTAAGGSRCADSHAQATRFRTPDSGKRTCRGPCFC